MCARLTSCRSARYFLLLCLIVALAGAAILDRIALTVEQQAITESQVDEEVRVTYFLNRQPARGGVDERRAAADRLIQQYLVEREMKLSHYPQPTENDVDKYLSGLSQEFGDASAFQLELARAKLTVSTLKMHLALQLTTVRFIEYRFRPNFEISDREIEAYRKRAAKTLPRETAREELVQEKTDEILGAWLEESRKQVNIVYLDRTLQ